MSTHRPRPGPRGPSQPNDIEWIGGIVSMPAHVTGEGEPYRPEALFWMGADGAILGSSIAKPGELLSTVGESLQSTIEEPMFGPPHAPTRVRVASPEMAEVLRDSHPWLDVVCEATPELDQFVALMMENLGEDGAARQSYLSHETGPDLMASFFKAAAALFRAEPWKLVPSDQSLFSVNIEQLGMRDAVLSIIGQMGESYGFVLCSDLDDFQAFLDAGEAIALGEKPVTPPHFALSFERGADLLPELRREIVEYQWEVATPNAYPWLVPVDQDLVTRPATAKEVITAEAIAIALTSMLAESDELRSAWEGGAPVSRTFVVPTHQGEIEVTLRVPYASASAEFDPSDDILVELAALAEDCDEIEQSVRQPLEDELMRRFAASPEAKDFDTVNACRLVMDFAASYFGATIPTVESADLREIIFQIIPRKVSVGPSKARRIIEENRAFYSFLKREYGLKQADACLRVLGGNAVQKLEAALSNSRNFGMAKSLVMGGQNTKLTTPTQEEARRKVAKAKKTKRKATRTARRKNR